MRLTQRIRLRAIAGQPRHAELRIVEGGHTSDVRRGLLGQGLTSALACVKRDGQRWPAVLHRAATSIGHAPNYPSG
nr:hypothetical protein [Burkholderia multivorans]